jgi:putative phosphoribosyl transferase
MANEGVKHIAFPGPCAIAARVKIVGRGNHAVQESVACRKQAGQGACGYKMECPAVLALARGGVPVAAEVCATLNAPLDLILVRKIGVPFQPELAMGAVAHSGTSIIVRNEDVIRLANIDQTTFKTVCDAELAEIKRRRQRYLGSQKHLEIDGRTAIVIDDGIATGATMKAALRAIRACNPKRLVFAVPVALTSTGFTSFWRHRHLLR